MAGMVLNYIYFILVCTAPFSMLAALIYAARLGVLSRRYRSGRILFSNIFASQLWGFMLLVYILISVMSPLDFTPQERAVIRIFFALYLVVQSFATIISLWYLRRNGEA